MRTQLISITDVNTLVSQLSKYDSGYVFRGQRDSSWKIKNGIERLFPEDRPLPDLSILRSYESMMLRKFKSIAHLYENFSFLPQEGSNFGWMSLMQHHGTPTRLIDFTSMPFMALFFAIDGASSYSKETSSIFAVSFREINAISLKQLSEKVDEIEQSLKKSLIEAPDDFYDRYISKGSHGLIWCTEPSRLTLRLRQQGGTFVVCDRVDLKFNNFLNSSEIYKDIVIDEIRFPHSMIPDIFILLSKMGITNKQIYPGLDGLSKDISQEMINYITRGINRAGMN